MSIPEDVMKTARDVCGDVAFGGGVITEHDLIVPTEEGTLIIARALMAERERGEMACRRLEWEEAGEPVKWGDIRRAFVAAIRNAGESK